MSDAANQVGNGTCGCLGCHEDVVAIVDHPKHGERTVCSQHAKDYEVVRYV